MNMHKSKSVRRKLKYKQLYNYKYRNDFDQHISDSDEENDQKKGRIINENICVLREMEISNDWISLSFNQSNEIIPIENENISEDFNSDESKIEAFNSSDTEYQVYSPLNEFKISRNNCKTKKTNKKKSNFSICNDIIYESNQLFVSFSKEKRESPHHNQLKENYEISPISSPKQNIEFKKGSKWLSNIQWHLKSPEKYKTIIDHDSHKKKNKYINEGLAEQLLKLQKKQNSEKVFWQHKDDLKQFIKGKIHILLKIMEFQNKSGSVICNCKLFWQKKKNSALINEINNIFYQYTYNNLKECIVLFDQDQFDKYNISTGCFVKLFSPWQTLVILNLKQPVILCTNFIEVMETNYSLLEYTSPKKTKEGFEVDKTIQSEIDCEIVEISEITTSSINNSCFKRDHNGCIFSAIERSINWKDMCLCVRVHRILKKNMKENSSNLDASFMLNLVVQDSSNSFCLIHLPQTNKWEPEFFFGKVFWFRNVHINQRLNSSRHPSLFYLFESLRNRQENEENISSDLFCYTFNYSIEDSSIAEEKFKYLPSLVLPEIKPLLHIMNENFSNKRCSFVAKAVWRWKKIIYITDISLISNYDSKEEEKENNYFIRNQKHYIELFVNLDFIPPLLESENIDCVISVIDCLVFKGMFTADNYSSIFIEYPVSMFTNYYITVNTNTLQILKEIKITDICQKSLNNADIGNLVNINGYITGIDEKIPFSWMECNSCKNCQLSIIDEIITCNICQTTIENPITKRNIEVFIIDSSNQEAKVRLHHSTMKNIFSHQMAEYLNNLQDVVIGMPLTSLTCCFVGKEYYPSNKKNIPLLEEIKII